ncbi:MAG TPA: hypothetical protein VJU82_17530 [Acidobacteriaceae bacterium]|nr:hypothetical protein [Acidobacteriaceae bacterium]
MHLHVPKPLHGWRAFAGEVGIIVIGVLIALAAEQAVETLHWRASVSQMREAMRSELAIDRTRVEVNLAQDECINARLDAILRWATSAPPGARIAKADEPFLWNYHTSTWDITKTSPTAGHFSLNEQLMYAGAYDSIANEQRYLFDEQGSWADLVATLASADRPESRGQLEHEVATARLHLTTRDSNGRSLLARLDELGIKPDPAGLPIHVDVHRLCRPLEG